MEVSSAGFAMAGFVLRGGRQSNIFLLIRFMLEPVMISIWLMLSSAIIPSTENFCCGSLVELTWIIHQLEYSESDVCVGVSSTSL
jgi:hypothetical protein